MIVCHHFDIPSYKYEALSATISPAVKKEMQVFVAFGLGIFKSASMVNSKATLHSLSEVESSLTTNTYQEVLLCKLFESTCTSWLKVKEILYKEYGVITMHTVKTPIIEATPYWYSP